jgi:hypothetical protein
MTEIKLIFDEPVQKKKAPKHLADLSNHFALHRLQLITFHTYQTLLNSGVISLPINVRPLQMR